MQRRSRVEVGKVTCVSVSKDGKLIITVDNATHWTWTYTATAVR